MGMIITENSLITQIEDDSVARLEKEQEYLDYIKEHINLVNKAYEIYLLLSNNADCVKGLERLANMHIGKYILNNEASYIVEV